MASLPCGIILRMVNWSFVFMLPSSQVSGFSFCERVRARVSYVFIYSLYVKEFEFAWSDRHLRYAYGLVTSWCIRRLLGFRRILKTLHSSVSIGRAWNIPYRFVCQANLPVTDGINACHTNAFSLPINMIESYTDLDFFAVTLFVPSHK